jgi:hypothetical protein
MVKRGLKLFESLGFEGYQAVLNGTPSKIYRI